MEAATIQNPKSKNQNGVRRSFFWRVAGILVGVQVATGLLAVALSAWFAYDRSLVLVENSLRLRLDRLAEEVEQRADSSLFFSGLAALPVPVRIDLTQRFPDPVMLLTAGGDLLQTYPPDRSYFSTPAGMPTEPPVLPEDLAGLLANGDIVIEIDDAGPSRSWGLAPVYDPDGFLVGGLLVQPLTNARVHELADTRRALIRAVFVVVALAGGIALVLGAFFTVRLVRPLRRITRQVERLGAGDYAARLDAGSDDEFGRLAASINQMAEAVEQSVETLKATDRLRRELVANVGHDLRTPLAALKGYLEEARRYQEAGDDAAAREALATAERQSTYLAQLINDLFELSLLDSTQPPLRREPIPLAELLHDAARAHQAAFEKAAIRFEVHMAGSLPLFEGDAVRLLRVLDNLLANARRHTPAGGTVHLHAEAADGDVRIAVQDSGVGMEPGVLAHVFERYYRGKEARTRQGQGTGLGLAISLAIARAHGGDLTATSMPGAGSTFTLCLPLSADDQDGV